MCAVLFCDMLLARSPGLHITIDDESASHRTLRYCAISTATALLPPVTVAAVRLQPLPSGTAVNLSGYPDSRNVDDLVVAQSRH